MNSFHLDDALSLDAQDKLAPFREQFYFPQHNDQNAIYFCGHSLGLQPKQTGEYVQEVLTSWQTRGVKGHFEGERPWLPYHELLSDNLSQLVGAKINEVICMQSLTANLHLLMASFYRPMKNRYKILIESHAFPSDRYAVQSQAEFHGFNPHDAIVYLENDPHQFITTDKIIATIEQYADQLALVLLPGVQFYSGQVLDIKKITQAAHKHNLLIGFDLAHAVGNIELQLHDWDVDFAVWCHYKYLNSGPGALGGAFVHAKHLQNPPVHFAGWWGHDKKTRFEMPNQYQAITNSAECYQLSNPAILSMAAILSSLDVFKQAGFMLPLREKSYSLTGFLEKCLLESLGDDITIISNDANARGAQLSIQFKQSGNSIYQSLLAAGVICDWREPNVMRIAPAPLYNNYKDVFDFVNLLKQAMPS